ncbi:MAG: hypothetical protein KDB80_10470 [Planctomycetes bacterium]|nr:hypothetical protein [Planctomycetota bacterium]
MSVEQVLTVARADHFGGDWPQGFVPLSCEAAWDRIHEFERSAEHTARADAEADPSRKQLIPYCALTFGDQILVVERLPAQGESRLHGRMSVGIGGHVNPEDGVGPGTIRRALGRELREELRIADSAVERAEPIGLINDDASEVGSVHVGLAFRIELRSDEQESLQIREISKMEGRFRRLAGSSGLWQYQRFLESWSRLLVGGTLVLMGGTELQEHSEGNGS